MHGLSPLTHSLWLSRHGWDPARSGGGQQDDTEEVRLQATPAPWNVAVPAAREMFAATLKPFMLRPFMLRPFLLRTAL